MTTYAFLLDVARCIGCEACVAACHTGNEIGSGATTIRIIERTSGDFPELFGWFQNQRCFHCNDAPCVRVCPTGAMYKEDGLTRLNRYTCIACEYCVDACPYEIPRIYKGRSFKCDGCNLVVKSGGTPWCVKTCPTQALEYGEREEILAEAHRRVEALRDRYPNAQVHGEDQATGLGVIMVLPDAPEVLDMPLLPATKPTIKAWQDVVKPVSLGLTSLSVAVTAVAALIARRNHVREVSQLEQRHAARQSAVQEDSSSLSSS